MSARSSAAVGPPHDPDNLIRQVLEMGAEFAGPAEDILLSWILSLGSGIDPASAANRLLDEHGLRHGAVPAGPIGRVWQLLRETARYPDDSLRPARRRPRRRPH
ncbi:MAG: hypothetical protein ACREE7_07455 [Dongiaceae bacterium]